MRGVFDSLLAVAGLPILGGAAYLGLLTLLSAAPAQKTPSTRHRFRFVVPAHDEQEGITATVASLFAVDYPRDRFDVLVVADNCSDDTAGRARNAGASVLERENKQQRGKGYALDYAFQQLPPEVDAVVVIDADTLVSPNLLQAFSARLNEGAAAVQADYAVRNARAGWRPRLMAIALGAFHIVRSRGRERLGLSCGLRGNGMCFTRSVLEQVPHRAYSIVEDVEYGIRLALAGHRVHYADEAHVYGEMVSTSQAAKSQRLRWEQGRAQLVREHMRPLFGQAFSRRDRVLLDLAMDMLVPPLSRLVTLAALGELAALGLKLALGGFGISLTAYGVALLLLVGYVLRGWRLSETGMRGLLDLGLAPVYVAWKLTLRYGDRKQTSQDWVRTTREAERE
jgi:1,2-diacylglycerol 3-beta-glucosyltransferase